VSPFSKSAGPIACTNWHDQGQVLCAAVSFLSTVSFHPCAFNPASISPCCVNSTCSFPCLFHHLRLIRSRSPAPLVLLLVYSIFTCPYLSLRLNICADSGRLYPPSLSRSPWICSPSMFCALFFVYPLTHLPLGLASHGSAGREVPGLHFRIFLAHSPLPLVLNSGISVIV